MSVKKVAGKIAVVGAAGGIGQPLSMLLAQLPKCSYLSLVDVEKRALGVAADVGHMDFPCATTGYAASDMQQALEGCDVVIVPAGVPRKPGMTRDDLFGMNASIAAQVAYDVSRYCPRAVIGVIANPVNSTVPIMAEVLKRQGVYDERKLMGVTTLDVVRANKFVSQVRPDMDPARLDITVIGGHSGPTIVPILSGVGANFTDQERTDLVKRIQYGGDEVVQAKDGGGSATLSMAHAANVWAQSVLTGMSDVTITPICTFVDSSLGGGAPTPFFSLPCTIGKLGVESVSAMPAMDSHEKELLAACVEDLSKNIEKGVKFAQDWSPKA